MTLSDVRWKGLQLNHWNWPQNACWDSSSVPSLWPGLFQSLSASSGLRLKFCFCPAFHFPRSQSGPEQYSVDATHLAVGASLFLQTEPQNFEELQEKYLGIQNVHDDKNVCGNNLFDTRSDFDVQVQNAKLLFPPRAACFSFHVLLSVFVLLSQINCADVLPPEKGCGFPWTIFTPFREKFDSHSSIFSSPDQKIILTFSLLWNCFCIIACVFFSDFTSFVVCESFASTSLFALIWSASSFFRGSIVLTRCSKCLLILVFKETNKGACQCRSCTCEQEAIVQTFATRQSTEHNRGYHIGWCVGAAMLANCLGKGSVNWALVP